MKRFILGLLAGIAISWLFRKREEYPKQVKDETNDALKSGDYTSYVLEGYDVREASLDRLDNLDRLASLDETQPIYNPLKEFPPDREYVGTWNLAKWAEESE